MTSNPTEFLCPRDRRSWGILFLSCLSFCHSVLFFETLTLLITFEQWVLELWYFTWIFSVVRPFRGNHIFFNLWPWPWILTHFLKTLILLIIFEQWVLELLYFTCVFIVKRPLRPFRGHHNFFYPVTLTLEFDPFFENFNLANNFERRVQELLYFTCVFLVIRPLIPFGGHHHFWPCDLNLFCDKNFLLVSRYLSLWSWPSFELLSGAFVFHKHVLFYYRIFKDEKLQINVHRMYICNQLTSPSL